MKKHLFSLAMLVVTTVTLGSLFLQVVLLKMTNKLLMKKKVIQWT